MLLLFYLEMIRVGRSKTTQAKDHPSFPNFSPIVCMTKSTAYGDIGPYLLKNEEGEIFENWYQSRKIYPWVPKNTEVYSRFDRKIIWQQEEEVHIIDNQPTSAYWNWRNRLAKNPDAVRYPCGFHHRSKCVGAIHNGQIYDYLTGRVEIYAKEYIRLVRQTETYRNLLSRLRQGENLLIIESDGPHQESLEKYKQTYGVGDDFIQNQTALMNRRSLEIFLNDSHHAFGHGYCLAWALLSDLNQI